MTYEQVKSLKQEDFKRLCRVPKRDFNQMLEVVRSGDRHKHLILGDVQNSTWKTNYKSHSVERKVFHPDPLLLDNGDCVGKK